MAVPAEEYELLESDDGTEIYEYLTDDDFELDDMTIDLYDDEVLWTLTDADLWRE